MKRRRFLALLGFFSVGSFWRFLRPSWRAAASEEHVARSVAALADVMFPGDGLPRATELGVHRRVLEMPEFRTAIELGVAWLDKHATVQGAADFLALDEVKKLAALDAAFASRDDGIQPFVLALRYHLGTAYYSAPSVKSAFAYTGPPQPEGFADFQERPA
jgi:gluconate 2-dehydrogenase subunit 3-like protein